MQLNVGEDNLIRWDRLEKASDGTYPSDATVTCTLYSRAGVALTSAISMSYVSGSTGRYQGILPASAYTLVAGTEYELRFDATGPGVAHRRIRVRAEYHRERD